MGRVRSILGSKVFAGVVWKGRSRWKQSDGGGSWYGGGGWSAWRLGEVGGAYDAVRCGVCEGHVALEGGEEAVAVAERRMFGHFYN